MRAANTHVIVKTWKTKISYLNKIYKLTSLWQECIKRAQTADIRNRNVLAGTEGQQYTTTDARWAGLLVPLSSWGLG